MQPAQLTAEHFAAYPPLARQVAIRGLEVLRQLPLSFVPLLLGEVIAYDSKFPAERQEVDAQFTFMSALSSGATRRRHGAIRATDACPPNWKRSIGSERPGEFSERLSAHLWTTSQVADFPHRGRRIPQRGSLRDSSHPADHPAPEYCGRRTRRDRGQLFRCFASCAGTAPTSREVDPTNGLRIVMQRMAARAKEHPLPFAHWYIDGGTPVSPPPDGLELLAYRQLDAIRDSVVAKLRSMTLAGVGTEARRSAMMQLTPEDVGLKGDGQERVLNHFKVAVLSDGSGAQFFSTTFVQWSAREVLRRAQPVTLLARFAPRVTERSMNEAITERANVVRSSIHKERWWTPTWERITPG